MAICLLEQHLTRANRARKLIVGKENGTNLRGAPRRTGKEAQIQDDREIWRQERRPLKSCRRIRENMGYLRQVDARTGYTS